MPVGRGAGGGLKSWLSRRTTGLQRILGLMLAFACLAGVSTQADAAQVAVVLSDDSAPYQEVYQVIRAHLDDSGHEVARVYVEGLTTASLSDRRAGGTRHACVGRALDAPARA